MNQSTDIYLCNSKDKVGLHVNGHVLILVGGGGHSGYAYALAQALHNKMKLSPSGMMSYSSFGPAVQLHSEKIPLIFSLRGGMESVPQLAAYRGMT